ncbi:hypothetical protein O7599_01295 [Streptomyces sp. WMMC500]|uniref:hypothetical protein n=1 Tax=Streptomyces sp. WMMC500 TaxID=3015154 RepID=UPI00248C00EF|nr:hypothetical protein [Streptomyces sp. WMMC500]WBB61225.1 hypothetical protein O7599_01295 [Streptomyces sp. WMMC500]
MARQGWWRPVAVAALAAICASGSELPDAVATASAPGPLPADRYDYTPEDFRRSQRATALLVRQCMAEHGHPDFPLDPRYPSDPIVATAVSTDYGAADLDDARRWGYGWDPAESPATAPRGRRMTSAEYADHPACSAAANSRLMRGIDLERDWLYASRRSYVVDKAVKRDKRMRAAWDEWSRCMADQGFTRYRSPVAAYTDDAWRRGSDGNTRHTRRERATAVADVTCKRRHGTVEIWRAVRAEKQTADIARHRDRYAAGLDALETNRANIAEVLREFA